MSLVPYLTSAFYVYKDQIKVVLTRSITLDLGGVFIRINYGYAAELIGNLKLLPLYSLAID